MRCQYVSSHKKIGKSLVNCSKFAFLMKIRLEHISCVQSIIFLTDTFLNEPLLDARTRQFFRMQTVRPFAISSSLKKTQTPNVFVKGRKQKVFSLALNRVKNFLHSFSCRIYEKIIFIRVSARSRNCSRRNFCSKNVVETVSFTNFLLFQHYNIEKSIHRFRTSARAKIYYENFSVANGNCGCFLRLVAGRDAVQKSNFIARWDDRIKLHYYDSF